MSSSHIAIEKLQGFENYGTWQVSIQALLELDDLWSGVVELASNSSGETIPADPVKDRKARSKMTLAIDTKLYVHIRSSTTAAAMWVALKEVFEDRGLNRKISLLRRLVNTKLTEFESMAEYINQIIDTSQQLQGIGFEIKEEMIGAFMLAGLPDEYKPMIMALEHSGMKITGSSIKMKLLQEKPANEGSEGAFYTQRRQRFGGIKKTTQLICRKCNNPGHLARDCKLGQNCQLGVEEEENDSCGEAWCTVLSTIGSAKDKQWYFDSGATKHMTNNKELLKNANAAGGRVFAANSSTMDIEATGTVTLFPSGANPIEVKDVLYVPNLSTNLLSVSQIVEKGFRMTFGQSGCTVYDRKGRIRGIGERVGNLFRLKQRGTEAEQSLACKSVPLETWHKRMGHLGYDNLMKLPKITKGVDFSNTEHDDCKICPMGKAARVPFPKGGSRATEILELVHSDICGPMPTPSIGGSRYLLSFIDDKSRKVFVAFLKTKSATEVKSKFDQFLAFTERQTGKKLRTLRTDNGSEYLNRILQDELKKCGIEHQTTCPYTPQQNGVAERFNRTLQERMRCMLSEAGLEDCFWAEAICYAAYLINRSPSSNIDTTPEEMWTGKVPDLSQIRIFGTRCMTKIPSQKQRKLGVKATEGVFVGINTQTKAYRVYDLTAKKVVANRDVAFLDEGKPILHGKSPNGRTVVELPAEQSDTDDSFDETELSDDADNDEFHDSVSISPEKLALPEQINSKSTPQLRRSDRERKIPGKLTDYVWERLGYRSENLQTVNEDEPMSLDDKAVETTNLAANAPPSQFSKTLQLQSQNFKRSVEGRQSQGKYPTTFYSESKSAAENVFYSDPQTPSEALSGPFAENWQIAMREEYEALMENNTWTLCDLPSGRKPIKCKWVFRTKRDVIGHVERFKARLVVKGCSQRKGVDYDETFAPVVRHGSLRYLFSLAARFDLDIYQMDAVSAFLQGSLDEVVFMEQAPYFQDKDSPEMVCRLNKALYGLKQSSRIWNTELDKALKEFGLKRSQHDPCVYFVAIDGTLLILAAYVDDLLVFSNNRELTNRLKDELNKKFKMKEILPVAQVLGIGITKLTDSITLNQKNYVLQILERFGMTNCRSVNTPMNSSERLSKAQAPSTLQEADEMKNIPYQEAVGCLMYLSCCTRPDISYAVSHLSRYSANPGKPHWLAVKHLLRYLKGTSNLGLTYYRKEDAITGYCDADYAADTDGRKSTSGFVYMASGGAISWASKRQTIVALSTCEAEYVSLSSAMQEAIWWNGFQKELGIDSEITVNCDNQSAIAIAKNGGFHPKRKHIDVRHHFVQDVLANHVGINLSYVSTQDQIADVLTKPLERLKLELFRELMGLKEMLTPEEEY